MTETVAHNPAETRFEIRVDGELAGFAEYSDHSGVRDFHHTVTYPQFRGRGLAAIVVREALDQTRNEGIEDPSDVLVRREVCCGEPRLPGITERERSAKNQSRTCRPRC